MLFFTLEKNNYFKYNFVRWWLMMNAKKDMVASYAAILQTKWYVQPVMVVKAPAGVNFNCIQFNPT